MTDRPILTIVRPSTPPIRVIVLQLHPPHGAATACKLARAWRRTIPTADIFTVSVANDDSDWLPALPTELLDRGTRRRPLVLAGICGAEATALQLGFDRTLPSCAGVLIGGRMLPPLRPLAEGMADRTARLRLIWEVNDLMAWAAALGELLSWFRAAGLDAQGAILEQEDDVATGKCRAGSSLSPAMIRMGRIYLAELVAVAMDIKPQPLFPPTSCLAQQTGTDSGTSRATGDESRSAQAHLELGGRQ
jgi:hypothetical protein